MNDSVPELVTKFLSGDQRAFAELVRRYRRKIYSLAFQILGNHLDADEVVQETFVRVYRKRLDLVEVKHFSSFVIRIATNYSIDLLRRRRGHAGLGEDASNLSTETQIELAEQVATPQETLHRKQVMEEIQRALATLPPKQRLTAVLHDIEGYSKAEIAAIFECPEATVRSNLHIARNKLKKILKLRLKPKE